jgi:hypothetical protein
MIKFSLLILTFSFAQAQLILNANNPNYTAVGIAKSTSTAFNDTTILLPNEKTLRMRLKTIQLCNSTATNLTGMTTYV